MSEATSDFANLSYLAQVRRLRELAHAALRAYDLRVRDVQFINHGENATFKVTDRSGHKYLLRVCRKDYHTEKGRDEELRWLESLHRKGFQVPVPVHSRSGRLSERVISKRIPDGRDVVLFRWSEGRFLGPRVAASHLFILGSTIAKLHRHVKGRKVRHRRYWTAEGMLGPHAKFGSIDDLEEARPAQQKKLTRVRRRLLSDLKKYERRFPERQGLIHSDLHFGNFLHNEKGLALIDFDDCGWGFFAYDLATPLISIKRSKKVTPERYLVLRRALIDGYKSVRAWDRHDEAILDKMLLARRLLMLGWLRSRSDNPVIKKHLKIVFAGLMKDLAPLKESRR